MKGLMGSLTGHDTILIQQLAVRCAEIQATLPNQVLFKDFDQDAQWWNNSDIEQVRLMLALDTHETN